MNPSSETKHPHGQLLKMLRRELAEHEVGIRQIRTAAARVERLSEALRRYEADNVSPTYFITGAEQ